MLASMNSPFSWPGGKRALKNTLLSLMPSHEIYAEVFAGSAKLLFAKEPSRLEIVNDVNGDLINFFRVAKHRPSELAEELEAECIHAGRFRELRADRRDASELERALRFAYLVWYSFGGKGEHFARPSVKSPKVKRALDTVRCVLTATAERLSGVLIEQRDFMHILDRYDSASTFFYLDPPYVEYGDNGRYEPLTAARREEMFKRLAKLKGRFLMSFDDCEEIRTLARARHFKVKSVGVVYTLCGAAERRTSSELLIANYDLAASPAKANASHSERRLRQQQQTRGKLVSQTTPIVSRCQS
jgi:DNA adenine methylase